MQCPYFTVLNYSTYQTSAKRVKAESNEISTAYQFELYTEDCIGGVSINGRFYPAQKGFFTCVKPGQTVKMIRPYTCCYFNLFTQDESLRELLDHLPECAMLWNPEEAIGLFREMLTIESTALLENRLQLEGCVCKIISLLAKARPLAPEGGQDNALLHKKNLQLADQYIQEHYAEDLSLPTLAAYCNLNPSYFHRLFTAAFGITPAKRLLTCRIAAAKMALLTENRSIAEIAESCGFSSQTYFGYKFKEVTGYSPLQYRKMRLKSKKKVEQTP